MAKKKKNSSFDIDVRVPVAGGGPAEAGPDTKDPNFPTCNSTCETCQDCTKGCPDPGTDKDCVDILRQRLVEEAPEVVDRAAGLYGYGEVILGKMLIQAVGEFRNAAREMKEAANLLSEVARQIGRK
jgi:hypothetical protein